MKVLKHQETGAFYDSSPITGAFFSNRYKMVSVILTNRTSMEYHEYEIKMIDETGINKVKIYDNNKNYKEL